MLEIPLSYTIFADARAQSAERVDATWGKFVRLLKDPPASKAKGDMRLLKLATFGDKVTPKGSHRSHDNVVEVFGIEGDYDAGLISLDTAAELCRRAGIEVILYSTPSSSPAAPRWRVIAPLSAPHHPAQHRHLVGLLNRALGGALAIESFTLSQTYYFGRLEGADYQFAHVDGQPLDLYDLAEPPLFPDQKIGAPTAGLRQPGSFEPLTEPERLRLLADLTSAVAALPQDRADDRKSWIDTGLALKSAEEALGEEALAEEAEGLWHKFSARSGKYDFEDADRCWRSFEPRKITFRSIFHWAKSAGWREPPKGIGLSKGELIKPFRPQDPSKIQPREWLYDEHYIRGFVGLTISTGGLGKSALTTVEAVAMATGRPLLGVGPVHRCRVWLFNGEDPVEELERRVAAVCLHHMIEASELEGYLYLGSGRDAALILADQGRDGVKVNNDAVAEIESGVRRYHIDVIIVDPFVSTHRVSENDNGAVDLVVKTWARIADVNGVAVEIVHHSRKMSNGGGTETTVDDARGASALLAAARSARALARMTHAEARKVGILPQTGVGNAHLQYFRVETGKANMRPAEAAKWFRHVSVELNNGCACTDPDGGLFFRQGDQVGVVERYSYEQMAASVPAEDVEKIVAAISKGEWRSHSASPNWVGIAVARAVGARLPDDRPQVKAIIEQLLVEEVIVLVTRLDAHRKQRDFIEVAPVAPLQGPQE